VSLNKLAEEWATGALAQLDAENHYRLRAARGRPEENFMIGMPITPNHAPLPATSITC